MKREKADFQTFCKTIKALRGDNGCPWDIKQNIQSLKKYIREETDELLDAIDNCDHQNICEESGDLLFLIVLLANINEESGHYSIDDVLKGINDKMVRRHPHVFGERTVDGEDELKDQWEKIKSLEKQKKTN